MQRSSTRVDLPLRHGLEKTVKRTIITATWSPFEVMLLTKEGRKMNEKVFKLLGQTRSLAHSRIVFLTLITFVVASAVVWATIPGSDGVIHGCYKSQNELLQQSGDLRVIDPGKSEKCRTNEQALNWKCSRGPMCRRGGNRSTGTSGTAANRWLRSSSITKWEI